MANRYVWSKWDVTNKLHTDENTREWEQPTYYNGNDEQLVADTYYFDSYTLDGTNFVPVNKKRQDLRANGSYTVPQGKYFTLNRGSSMSEICKALSGGATIRTGSLEPSTSYKYKLRVYFCNYADIYYRKAQGDTSYGNVSSTSSGAYPNNNYKGDIWYVKQGSDTIDPAAVTYDASTVIAGETVSVTISPSSGNTYGGTITYIVQTNVDEQGWETELETTSTSVSLAIPEGSVSWRVRVRAKDNMGFTSSDYVYGNNAVNDPTTVIYPSVFAVMPEDKNLGYLATGQIVTYLVTTDDNVDYNIVVTVDGTEILSETQSPKARILTLSDEVWNGLSAEQVHTAIMTITQGDKSIAREFTFKKFVYDYSNLKGLFDGIARAIRIKRVFNKQLTAANFPKEVLKISSIKEEIVPSYIDVTVPYVAGGTVVATHTDGTTYGANLDASGTTRVTVDTKGVYTIRGYVGNSPSSSANVTIENDGDTVSATVQWIKLTVTVESGASVTATCGDNTVTAISSGMVDLYLPTTGAWSLSATKSGYSFAATGSVQINGYGSYATELDFVSQVFGDNSWATIQRVTKAGKAASYWNVGDMKAVKLNGTVGSLTFSNETYYTFILGFNHNSTIEGSNTIHLQFGKNISGTDIAFCDVGYNVTHTITPSARFTMGISDDNSGGWKDSYIHKTICPAFLSVLPIECQNVIAECNKYSDNFGGDSSIGDYVTKTWDKIWLLSEFEVFGVRNEANTVERNYQKQYDYYKNGNSKVKYKHNSSNDACSWWLRSTSFVTVIFGFCIVNIDGSSVSKNANLSLGFAPGFAIG